MHALDQRAEQNALHEGRDDGAAEEGAVPDVFARRRAVAELERDAAEDEREQKPHHRQIEGGQDDGVGRREKDQKAAAAEHEPRLVAVPEGRDRIHHGRARRVVRREGKENADAEVETVEHDIEQDGECDDTCGDERKIDHGSTSPGSRDGRTRPGRAP